MRLHQFRLDKTCGTANNAWRQHFIKVRLLRNDKRLLNGVVLPIDKVIRAVDNICAISRQSKPPAEPVA